MLHAIETMVAAWVINFVSHDGRKKLCKGNGAPHHDNRQGEEPFPYIKVEDAHELHAYGNHEYWNDEG